MRDESLTFFLVVCYNIRMNVYAIGDLHLSFSANKQRRIKRTNVFTCKQHLKREDSTSNANEEAKLPSLCLFKKIHKKLLGKKRGI